MSSFRQLATAVATIILVSMLGVFIAAALARYSPGYGSDASDIDARFSAETLKALRAKRLSTESLPAFYFRYLRSLAHGDFGTSESFQQPIGPLLADRLPYTATLVIGGSISGCLLALFLASLTLRFRGVAVQTGMSAGAGLLLALPPAVLALVFFYTRAPLILAMALVIMPRVYGSLQAMLAALFHSDNVIAARARGLHPGTIAARYFLQPAAGRLAALFGTAMVIAFGYSVPMEALCGKPGIGQLTWKAALSRDLPLLSALALIVTVTVTALNAAADLLAIEDKRA